MTPAGERPLVAQVVLDTTDARGLAEFYRQLLGLSYRDGDEPPPEGEPDVAGHDWLVLRNPGGVQLAFQQVDDLAPASWPDAAVPQQLHLDLTVRTREALEAQRERATALGATVLLDRTDDPDEPLYVLADPAGHPFCVFVG